MKQPGEQYLKATFFGVVGLVLAGVLVLPLLFGVWLPDAIFSTRNTLASTTLDNGYNIKVVQYWNHGDFYSTDLLISAPDGTTSTNMLDGDDFKSWNVPLRVYEDIRLATVTLSGGRRRTVSW